MATSSLEKTGDNIAPAPDRNSISSIEPGKVENAENNFEVFKSGDGSVEFRTVGWIQASVIFLKSKSSVPTPSST